MRNDAAAIRKAALAASVALLAVALCLCGCSSANDAGQGKAASPQEGVGDTSGFLRIVGEEPDTADPQCTDDDYDVPLNVFDRLVEVRAEEDGTNSLVPSLADSWEVSDDGLVYTFHLHEGVTFSNGSPFTSSDVQFTLERALTYPDSQMADIAMFIVGADELVEGKAKRLEGFKVIDDRNFAITLSVPYSAFLAILSIPGASILDEETTSAAGSEFGKDPSVTVGTGPFVLSEWVPGTDLVMTANQGCWSGAPGCPGVVMQFVTDPEAKRLMFEKGELDILDLEDLGPDAEYFMRGDIYQDQLVHGNRVGLSFIAFNETVKPLDDVRVRHALQLALNRNDLLTGVYSGRGKLENGIYPHGLIGFNPDLPEIPYDPEAAKALLAEAGYPDGFDLEICVDSESPSYREIANLAAGMWERIGVRATVNPLPKDEFVELRKSGGVACYPTRFSVDYNDPEAIIYIFFGGPEYAQSRSLGYDRQDIFDRVNEASSIVDEAARLAEYRELERIIVHEDCAWAPLFSNEHYFVVSDRTKNFHVSWNGWTNTKYRDIVIEDN